MLHKTIKQRHRESSPLSEIIATQQQVLQLPHVKINNDNTNRNNNDNNSIIKFLFTQNKSQIKVSKKCRNKSNLYWATSFSVVSYLLDIFIMGLFQVIQSVYYIKVNLLFSLYSPNIHPWGPHTLSLYIHNIESSNQRL